MWLGLKFSAAPMPFLIVTPERKMCKQLVLVFNVMSAFRCASNIHHQISGCKGAKALRPVGSQGPFQKKNCPLERTEGTMVSDIV